MSGDFALFGQMWLDICFFERQLLDSPDGLDSVWPADEAISSAFSDAWRAASSFPGLQLHPGNDIADRVFVEMPSDAVEDAFRPYSKLTTRVIWEAACTLDELATYHHSDEIDKSEHHQMVRAKLAADSYGFALRVAHEMAGPVSEQLFRLVAWLATDPPLPFLDGTVIELEWSRFTPPYRFIRLYAAIHDNPALREVPRGGALEDFADDLLRAAGLQRAVWPSTPVRPGLNAVRGSRIVNVHDFRTDFESFPGAAQEFVGSLNMLTRASLALRAAFEDVPEKLAYPSDTDAYVAKGGSLDRMADAQSLRSLLLPLAMDFADGLYQGGYDPSTSAPVVSPDHLALYIVSVVYRASLDSFITGKGVRWEMLPRKFRLQFENTGEDLMRRFLRSNREMRLDW